MFLHLFETLCGMVCMKQAYKETNFRLYVLWFNLQKWSFLPAIIGVCQQ